MEKDLGWAARTFEWIKTNPFDTLGLAVAALVVLIVWKTLAARKKDVPPPISERVRHDLEKLNRKRQAPPSATKVAPPKGITLADMAAFRPQRETPPEDESPKAPAKPQPPSEAVFATLTQYEMQAAPLNEDLLYGVSSKSEKAENPTAPTAEPAAKSSEPAPRPTSNAMIACPNCGKGILAEARFCGYCGKKTGP